MLNFVSEDFINLLINYKKDNEGVCKDKVRLRFNEVFINTLSLFEDYIESEKKDAYYIYQKKKVDELFVENLFSNLNIEENGETPLSIMLMVEIKQYLQSNEIKLDKCELISKKGYICLIDSNTNTSRKLSYILRHNPQKYGINLINGGWANVGLVLKGLNTSMQILEDIVSSDSKGRYSFNEDKTLIKAEQGHSTDVDLGLIPTKPPEFLYHGTVQKVLPLIMKDGLIKMKRHAVHLSEKLETAKEVSERRKSENVMLKINSGQMHKDGLPLYVTENNVWLTDNVPSKYIKVLD